MMMMKKSSDMKSPAGLDLCETGPPGGEHRESFSLNFALNNEILKRAVEAGCCQYKT